MQNNQINAILDKYTATNSKNASPIFENLPDNLSKDESFNSLRQTDQKSLESIQEFYEDFVQNKREKGDLQIQNAIKILDYIVKHSESMEILGEIAMELAKNPELDMNQFMTKYYPSIDDEEKRDEIIEKAMDWAEFIKDDEVKDTIPTPEQYRIKAQTLQPLLIKLEEYKKQAEQPKKNTQRHKILMGSDTKISDMIGVTYKNLINIMTIMKAFIYSAIAKSLSSKQEDKAAQKSTDKFAQRLTKKRMLEKKNEKSSSGLHL